MIPFHEGLDAVTVHGDDAVLLNRLHLDHSSLVAALLVATKLELPLHLSQCFSRQSLNLCALAVNLHQRP